MDMLQIPIYRTVCGAAAMPSPGGKVPPQGADEECGWKSDLNINASDLFGTTVLNLEIRRKSETFCISIVLRPHSSSVGIADSFPPGEAMGAPASV